MYGILADLIAVFHLGYVSYVIVGQLLIILGLVFRWGWIRNFTFRLTHLLCIAVVALEAATSIQCPLTVWEEDLRVMSGQPPTGMTFMQRVVDKLLFFDGISWDDNRLQWAYYLFAGLVLATFILIPPRWPWKRETALPAVEA